MKAFLTLLGTGRLIALLGCAFLAVLAFFLKFCLPGYSFSALVCICLIAIILFYAFMPMLGMKFPGFAKWTTRVFTFILVIGLLVVGITEAVIIKASFGDPKEQVEYMVARLLGQTHIEGPLDTTDALGIAVCHLTLRRFRRLEELQKAEL